MSFLRKAIFKQISHFWAVLPYNLNWMIKNTSYISNFLEKNPLNIVDIGGRDGSLHELHYLKEYVNYVGFDADKEECLRLENNPPSKFHSFKIFPNFVGNETGEIDFNLFKLPGQSSSLKPGKRFSNIIAEEYFQIEKVVKVQSDTLNSLSKKYSLLDIDMLKLDTQGTELKILQNADIVLENVLLIESEVEFIEMYQNQDLFHDISIFLYSKGYELLYLNRVFHTRKNYYGESRGQMIWGDALFAKREDELHKYSPEKLAKYVILLINYGHIDYADSIIKLYPDIIKLVPNVYKYFRYYRKSFLNKALRVLFFQYDKVLMLLLHFRKSNKNLYDDDRSWPTR